MAKIIYNDIDGIRKMLCGITEWPWKSCQHTDLVDVGHIDGARGHAIMTAVAGNRVPVNDIIGIQEARNNCDFAAAAPKLVHDLISEIEEWRALCCRLECELQAFKNRLTPVELN